MNPSQIIAAAGMALAGIVPGAAAQEDGYYVKVKPTLSLEVKPKRDRLAPFRYTAAGKLITNGVPKDRGCVGRVSLRIRRGARTVARGTTNIRFNCRYSKSLKVRKSKLGRLKRGTLKVTARYSGNDFLSPDSAPAKKVKFG